MKKIEHVVPNPERNFGHGDFLICCEIDGGPLGASVSLSVNHDGGSDNGEIRLEGSTPPIAVAVIDGLIAGLQKARSLIASVSAVSKPKPNPKCQNSACSNLVEFADDDECPWCLSPIEGEGIDA